MIDRRRFAVTAGLAALFAGAAPAVSRAAPGAEGMAAAFARIERESGGRLGVAVIDTGSGARSGHRADERFAMCSTFKVLAAAAVLARVDGGRETLDRRIAIDPAALLEWAPLTRPHAGGEMTVEALAEAAMVMSDNTAANLLLAALDGPAGLTAWVRTLGDAETRLDRTEPALNEAVPGDPRDTTTPEAMADDIRKLVLGHALSGASRDKLTGWLVGNRTGDARLRAGLPKDVRVGDKTGSGERGTTNDVGLFWPPGRAPLVVAAYLTECTAPPKARDATLAAVAKAVAASL
ncbi:class A beta-lactamase [Rhodoplanes sp. TEM]|uniref:Beta-lactamase n=1 Tax=Rhodoplanes tepidamans TaxID=200616 RepID=A0ABT5JEY0_RHOTP|nr:MULTISPECIES: class A beta-lactamase [Rhodoplanes]MDC7788251.1 class A beta-lactamase [Rhodoplanes tepidamans]MDC7982944.1 class A beta-lactamase [Rhodoplanes sp. TEM]MDQ0355881.1 beta-lactamase class A [Rhodoplanes tepidamans]